MDIEFYIKDMLMTGWEITHDPGAARLLRLAEATAELSNDPSTHVGCVLATDQGRVVSVGLNAFPGRIKEDHRIQDRSVKYDMIVHAEANAILNAGHRAYGTAAFITHPPCSRCMGLLINSGVTQICCAVPSLDYLSRWRDSMMLSEAMADEAGVNLRLYTNPPSQETN